MDISLKGPVAYMHCHVIVTSSIAAIISTHRIAIAARHHLHHACQLSPEKLGASEPDKAEHEPQDLLTLTVTVTLTLLSRYVG